jgi:hypothetical protein
MDMKFLRIIEGKTRGAGIQNMLLELTEKRLQWFGHAKGRDSRAPELTSERKNIENDPEYDGSAWN